MSIERIKIRVNGIVQGVGFRPFVYRLAKDLDLAGYVNNDSDGVAIEVEGLADDLNTFRDKLRSEAPPLSRIVDLKIDNIPANGDTDFIIKQSQQDDSATTLISPDIATCDDCLGELFDPADRRYRYPFINCTNCGPRYTIVESIPYDRPKTSMKRFPLCPECDREYHDPADRRFHAQPNACPVCGPKLTLHDHKKIVETGDPIQAVVDLLKNGKIVAIRGVGGFHLAVDSHNDDAIMELRRRKGRAEKPFAMMAPDIESVKKHCQVSSDEEVLLKHYTAPIVLLKRKPDSDLAGSVAPSNNHFGFMLAYSPLHHLLLRGNFDALIMTSGNYSEEPIAIGNDEAKERLFTLADYMLVHDREILQRCDDSIARYAGGKSRVIRRSRGYAPRPVFLEKALKRKILACGGELKNTIALSRDNTVFLSQHIGDLDNPSAYSFFEHVIDYLRQILVIKPEIIACDLHPEYLSAKWAKTRNDLPLVEVQHHHAHLVSVMSENGVYEPTIGIILDGTGFGTDGTIWGGEVLIGDASGFDRFAYLQPAALPGGTAAIQNPWRMAVSYLYRTYNDDFRNLELPILEKLKPEDIEIVKRMMDQNINSPMTSSCGRLFDAVSALLDIRYSVNFEAQAAIELEMVADTSDDYLYEDSIAQISAGGDIPTTPLIKEIVQDILDGQSAAVISSRFHRSLAEMFIESVKIAKEKTGINNVGLSGGVYQNVYFFNYLLDRLEKEGFNVITHSEVPTNDGGIALGQVVIADALIENQIKAR